MLIISFNSNCTFARRKKEKMRNWLCGFIVLVVSQWALSQELDIKNARQITFNRGDNLNAAWSPDGTKLAFQTNSSGNWDICYYDLLVDSVFTLVKGKFDEQHPVWFPDGKSIVFDSDSLGIDYLFLCRLSDKKIEPLFTRKIICKEASFPPDPRQVYFSGYDKISQEWQIYSYDFIYDNLNQLTFSNSKCTDPQVAPDGKNLLFYKSETVFESSAILFINWYGEENHRMDSLKAQDVVWDPKGLKMYFISDRDDQKGELYSIWKNGSHLERITNDSIGIQDPAISPDGRIISVAVEEHGGSELFLFELTED